MNAVSVNNVYKRFGDVEALRGVTLEIRGGEFYGLLGPNGAGKTTMLRILSGILPPTSGTITLLEKDLSAWRKSPVLGVVPQDIALYDMLTARRNLEVFGSVLGLNGRQLKERSEILLDLVELTAHGDRRVKTFSGGMKRRLNLAIGLLHDPQVLLLDEPTVGVDPQSRVKIFALLRELHDAGKTIIYTTHYMEEAERLCDRIGIIDHGKLLAEGTLSELLTLVNLPRCVRVFVSVETVQLPDVEFAGKHSEADHTDYTPKRPEQLGQLVSHIEQSGMHYDRMEIVGPNLETLFLQLTGKELRDV